MVDKLLNDIVASVLFFGATVFWVALIVTGGGPLLGWAALTSAASGAALIAFPSNWITRPLAGASTLFGITLAIYQISVASTLLGTSLAGLGDLSITAFAVFIVVYLYLLYNLFLAPRSTAPTQSSAQAKSGRAVTKPAATPA